MGFALTLLYLGTTYLGTETVFGPLVVFHVEVIIAALVFLVSLPSVPGAFVLKTPQSLALVGLGAAVFISVLLTGWFGGAVQAFQTYIPSAFAYFLICLNCRSKKKLQIIVLMLLLVCLFNITRGAIELQQVNLQALPAQGGQIMPYLMGQRNDAGDWFFRITGQNLINDPNDFAQLIASVIPLTFIFWRRKKSFQNFVFVILPICGLLYGAFLTHSRGFLIAFGAMAIVAGRRRIGLIPSLVGGTVLFLGATLTNFTGGRDVSVKSGTGRMVLWASGLGLLKSHPLFGIGFGRLPEYLDGMTAHNSIVACIAELGVVGFFFWSMFLFTSLRDSLVLSSPGKVRDGVPIVEDDSPFQRQNRKVEPFDKDEAIRLGELLILSFTGFLVAGFFLSRDLVLTFFLLGGIAEVVYEMALQREIAPPRLRLERVLIYSAVLTIVLPVFVDIVVRFSVVH